MGYEPWRWPPFGTKHYACSECKREIQFSQVETMGQIHGETFFLSHTCECRSTHIFERSFVSNPDAINRLRGPLRPVFPYRAAPRRGYPLREHQEKALVVFGWECQQLESVAEFLLLCSRPPLAPPA